MKEDITLEMLQGRLGADIFHSANKYYQPDIIT